MVTDAGEVPGELAEGLSPFEPPSSPLYFLDPSVPLQIRLHLVSLVGRETEEGEWNMERTRRIWKLGELVVGRREDKISDYPPSPPLHGGWI